MIDECFEQYCAFLDAYDAQSLVNALPGETIKAVFAGIQYGGTNVIIILFESGASFILYPKGTFEIMNSRLTKHLLEKVM